jgi:branched-chain amino acid transport system permease protein
LTGKAVSGVRAVPARTRSVRGAPGTLLPAAAVLAVVAATAVVYATGGKSPQLVTQAIITGVLLGGVYGLVSIGLTLIFGVLGIVNFAQGTLLTVAMYVAYVLVTSAGFNVYVATLVATPALFGIGYAIQATMLNRLMRPGGGEGQLLVTLGLSLLLANLLLLTFGGLEKTITPPLGGNLHLLGAIAPVSRVIAFGGAVLLAVALTVVLHRTRLGVTIRSVAANAQGAQLVGVNIRRVFALTFGLGTATVGAAGGLLLPFLSLTPSTGEQFTILAFVIVVLGGLGSVRGAMVGGLTVGLVQTVGGLYLPGTGALLLVFAVFILVLFLRPQGLFGGAP